MNRIKMVCNNCGSENVLKDAYAAWNVDSQQWELSNTFDNNICDDCGATDSVDEMEVENAGV